MPRAVRCRCTSRPRRPLLLSHIDRVALFTGEVGLSFLEKCCYAFRKAAAPSCFALQLRLELELRIEVIAHRRIQRALCKTECPRRHRCKLRREGHRFLL